ncbi:hypothetical protein ACOSQ2_021862 [Xanthoceras sorbifolium]
MKKDTNKGGPHNKEENEVEDLVEEVQKPEVEAEEEETQIEEDVNESFNFTEKEQVGGESLMLMAHNSTYQNQNVWFLDSGASNHMTGRKDLFTELDEKVHGEISFGDLSKIPVQGRGDVMIKQKNGDHAFISNVYYVPDMKTNILSLGKLLEKGYHISL